MLPWAVVSNSVSSSKSNPGIPFSQRPAFWWSLFALGTALILTLAPYANSIQKAIRGQLGGEALRWGTLAVVAVAASAAVGWARRHSRIEPWRVVWTLAVAALVVAGISRIAVAAETVHLVEYAAASALAFRALSFRFRDPSVYIAASAVTAFAGMFDEFVQWLIPGRFWGLHDIGINVAGAVAMQLVIWQGARPAGIAARPTPGTLRAALRLTALAAAFLGVMLLNTPQRIASYASRVPGLDHLGKDLGTFMADYGHRYTDPEIGVFRSRLTLAELERIDRDDTVAAAARLEASRGAGGYAKFFRLHPLHRDPFGFEVRVHLVYRNRLWARAWQETDPAEKRRLATMAFRENLILEKYFGHTLRQSSNALKPGVARRMAALHDADAEFESEVSNFLLTSFTEAQAFWGLFAVLVAMAAVDRWLSRRG